MAQIVNTPRVGQILGQQMANPILQSLQTLTQMQLDNISKRRERAGLFAGLSSLMPKGQAGVLSHMPKESLGMIVPQILKNKLLSQGLDYFERAGGGMQGAGQDTGQAGQDTKAPTQFHKAMSDEDKERYFANQKAGQAFAMTNGNSAVAFQVQDAELKRAQKERFKQYDMLSEDRKANYNYNQLARKGVPKLQETVDNMERRIQARKIQNKLLGTKQVATGWERKMLKSFGMEDVTANPTTAMANQATEREKLSVLADLSASAAKSQQAILTAFNSVASMENPADSIRMSNKLSNEIDRASLGYKKALLDEYSKEKYQSDSKRIPPNIGSKIWEKMKTGFERKLDQIVAKATAPKEVAPKEGTPDSDTQFVMNSLNSSKDSRLDVSKKKVGDTVQVNAYGLEAIIVEDEKGNKQWAFSKKLGGK